MSPIAESKTAESSLEESKAIGTTESVVERSYVVISKQVPIPSEKVDDEVASVLLTTERQDSGNHLPNRLPVKYIHIKGAVLVNS